uniref:DNA polymerase III subunit delta n=1 Tax=Ndongobacter massiliensis TaxID=1871025 RepID=UPI0009314927|nr:hypothetical protein [Ndongobacter massiliensis]
MDYIAWLKKLDEQALEGIYFCKVEEPYLWDRMDELLRGAVGDAFLPFNYERLNFRETTDETLDNALETLPMFSEKRYVILEDIDLARDRLKNYESLFSVLTTYFAAPNPQTVLFIVFYGAAPFRGKFVKSMEKVAQEVVLDRLNRSQLRGFIQKQLAQAGVRTEEGALSLLLGAGGYLEAGAKKKEKREESLPTLYDVENEVKKAQAAARKGKLCAADLEGLLLVSIEDNIFQLTDALSARDVGRALRLYQGFQALQEDPYRSFYMIVRHIRNLLGVKLCQQGGVPAPEGQRRLKLSRFEYQKLQQAERAFSLSELEDFHEKLWEIERNMKTQPVDLSFAMERFFARFQKNNIC